MKTRSMLIVNGLLAIMFAVLFLACGKSDEKAAENEESKDKTTAESMFVADGKYFCPMHPTQQTDDANARCPICKMKLDSKEQHYKEMLDEHEALEKRNEGKKNAIHFEMKLAVIKSDECLPIIESALSKDQGILDYSIDILDSVIHMYIDKTKTSKSNVEKLISDAGFDANETKANPEAASGLPDDCK